MRHTNFFSIGNAIYDYDYYRPVRKEKETGTNKSPKSISTTHNATTRGTDLFSWTIYRPVAITSTDLNYD